MSASLVGSEMCIRDRFWDFRYSASTPIRSSIFGPFRPDLDSARRRSTPAAAHVPDPDHGSASA
eukprot:14813478-Alexandrium_andersonii.AAC.1